MSGGPMGWFWVYTAYNPPDFVTAVVLNGRTQRNTISHRREATRRGFVCGPVSFVELPLPVEKKARRGGK